MRVVFAIAVAAFSLAGITAAGAGHFSEHRFAHAHRAGMVWIVDDEPGVAIRAYWRAPWRHHHYFPATGKRPRVGRRENLSARSHVQRAQAFARGWSNEWAFEDERAPREALPPLPDLK